MSKKPIWGILILVFIAASIAILSTDPAASTLAATSNDMQVHLPIVYKNYPDNSWYMAGANPQRTSWISEEVRDRAPLWYKPFEAYILPKVQIITGHGSLFISTAKGLYALNANKGNERWVYPTEMPLGHSPTLHDGILYVGGYDHKLHAVNAYTGEGIWTFEAGAGFDTNPLVVGDKAFLGNRDGYFYAVYISGPDTGEYAWKFPTQGPVSFSAAYKDGVVYFASNDSHAYALRANTGGLVWKSEKLLGAGFQSWWPVVYQNRVIFAGSNNYRSSLKNLERDEDILYPPSAQRGTLIGPRGTEPGDWVPGTTTINADSVRNYFNTKPWRKTYFVLDRSTGAERETAPVLWTGTYSGNRYPPVVGSDGVLYQQNNYMYDPFIPGGQVSGWKFGTPHISVISSDWGAVDEPHAYSAGGDLIYWNQCCDRQAGAIDISIPNTGFNPSNLRLDTSREWYYFSADLRSKMPGYDQFSFNWAEPSYAPTAVYGSETGVYGFHGDVNPPIPYQGKVFMHRSNSILAFGNSSSLTGAGLPTVPAMDVQNANLAAPSDIVLEARLAEQVQKIVDAGHLQPGYHVEGRFHVESKFCGDRVSDYFHHPGDTLYALTRALPYLSDPLKSLTEAYLQKEYADYMQYNHIGFRTGAKREIFIRPPLEDVIPEVYDPKRFENDFDGWDYAPHSFYALWKYAEAGLGDPLTIYNASKDMLETPLLPLYRDLLISKPHVLNAYIAGYIGYIELARLAGEPESAIAAQNAELINLLALRKSAFSTYTTYENTRDYCRTLAAAQNFMYLVPELADELRSTPPYPRVLAALAEYDRIVPYWFVTNLTVSFGEGTIHQLYDASAIFNARALIQGASRQELAKYLDVPAFHIGDLLYIDKLILMLETD